MYKENVSKDDDIIPNWWQYWYSETFTSLPPEVLYKNGNRVYYNFLFACEETEEATINDLLDRINHIENYDTKMNDYVTKRRRTYN